MARVAHAADLTGSCCCAVHLQAVPCRAMPCQHSRSATRTAHATCNTQQTARNMWHATCNVQQRACSRQHTTCSMQRATRSMQHAAHTMHHDATCNPAPPGQVEIERCHQRLPAEPTAALVTPPPLNPSLPICSAARMRRAVVSAVVRAVVRTYVRTYVRARTYTHVRTYVRVYARVRSCVCTSVYI